MSIPRASTVRRLRTSECAFTSPYIRMTPHVYSNRSSGLQICNAHVSGVTHYVDRHELGLFERRDMLAFMREAGLRARFQEQGLMQGRGLCRGQGLSLRHRLERRRVGKGAV